jgi:hypothetical protein
LPTWAGGSQTARVFGVPLDDLFGDPEDGPSWRWPSGLPLGLRSRGCRALCLVLGSLTVGPALDDEAFTRLFDGCDAVLSCLGHNLSVRGMFGKPRALVTQAARRVCRSAAGSGELTSAVGGVAEGHDAQLFQCAAPPRRPGWRC